MKIISASEKVTGPSFLNRAPATRPQTCARCGRLGIEGLTAGPGRYGRLHRRPSLTKARRDRVSARDASVEGEAAGGDESRVIARQIGGRRGEFVDTAEAAHRHVNETALHLFGAIRNPEAEIVAFPPT